MSKNLIKTRHHLIISVWTQSVGFESGIHALSSIHSTELKGLFMCWMCMSSGFVCHSGPNFQRLHGTTWGEKSQPLAAMSIRTGSLLERWILALLQGIGAGACCCCWGGGWGCGWGLACGRTLGDAGTVWGLMSKCEYRHMNTHAIRTISYQKHTHFTIIHMFMYNTNFLKSIREQNHQHEVQFQHMLQLCVCV